MDKIGLTPHKDTQAGALSGGNKRKLCLAMALIGRPKILFIDEASAGVDPGARRSMWKAIKSEGEKSAIVITTHAMEEAEALATKLGIMVQGKIKCFGTANHIREKYGSGYEVEINIDLQDIMTEMPDIPEENVVTTDAEVVKAELAKWQEKFDSLDYQIVIDGQDEFTRFGLLSSFYTALQKGERVNLRSVQREYVLQNVVGSIGDEISQRASMATVQQLDGAYVRLKLQKNQKSYGEMYCLLEELKTKYSIKEYQVK